MIRSTTMFTHSVDMGPMEELQLDDVSGTVCRCQVERADYEHVGIAFIEVERGKPAGLKHSGIGIGDEKVSEVIVMPPVDIMYHT
jgi:hypothetical protein